MQHDLPLRFRDEAAAGRPDDVRRVPKRRVERLRRNAILAGTRELHIAVEARAGRGLDENPLGVPEPPLVAVKRAVVDRSLRS